MRKWWLQSGTRCTIGTITIITTIITTTLTAKVKLLNFESLLREIEVGFLFGDRAGFLCFLASEGASAAF
jgi:hypothetical protein